MRQTGKSGQRASTAAVNGESAGAGSRDMIDCRKPRFSNLQFSACMRCYEYTYHQPIVPELCTLSPGQRSLLYRTPTSFYIIHTLLLEHEHAKPRHRDRGSRHVPCTSVLHCFPLASCERLFLPRDEATLSEHKVGSWLRLSLWAGQDRLLMQTSKDPRLHDGMIRIGMMLNPG